MESEKILGVVFCVVVLVFWIVSWAYDREMARASKGKKISDKPAKLSDFVWVDRLEITNSVLLEFTAGMPMKQINVGGPYLQRYYGGVTDCGRYDLWLHRFLSQDGDRHLHNHPFEFRTIALLGGYTEEFKTADGVRLRELMDNVRPLSFLNRKDIIASLIFKGHKRGIGTWHRIAKVEPNTWTALLVDRENRVPFWYFEDEGGYTTMAASGPDWWKGAKTRAEQAADGVVQEVWHG